LLFIKNCYRRGFPLLLLLVFTPDKVMFSNIDVSFFRVPIKHRALSVDGFKSRVRAFSKSANIICHYKESCSSNMQNMYPALRRIVMAEKLEIEKTPLYFFFVFKLIKKALFA
jgi:hypothetical protein